MLLCHIHLPVCLRIMVPHGRAAKNTSHWNQVLLQDNYTFIQRLCYQRGSPCQDPAGNRTTWRSLTIIKWCKMKWYGHIFLFITFGQNLFARHSERGKKTRQTEKEVGRQHQGMDRPWICQVPEGGGEQGKMEETHCEPTVFVCVCVCFCFWAHCSTQPNLMVKG